MQKKQTRWYLSDDKTEEQQKSATIMTSANGKGTIFSRGIVGINIKTKEF